MAALAGRQDVIPVVRAARSVARNAHLGLAHRFGDASRPESLARALEGCEAVVDLTKGSPADMLRVTETVHAAALAARARVVVHLSSATVYAGVERPDLADDAPPRRDHWMRYAREKGRAESFLRERMADPARRGFGRFGHPGLGPVVERPQALCADVLFVGLQVMDDLGRVARDAQ